MSSAIIDKLEKDATGVIVYYYFSFRDKATQNVTNFKHSLLMQIVRRLVREDETKQHFYVPKVFQNLFEKYSNSQFPLVEDVHATFEGLLDESSHTYIIIDALDECPDQTGRSKIIKFLEGLCRTSHGGAHILMTSRRENDIETAINEMEVSKSIVLMKTAEVNADIRTYLMDSMRKQPYKDWPARLKITVARKLTSKADGVFRWAALQLLALKDKDRDKDVEDALKDLPKNLVETYEVMLTRIESSKRSGVALSILRWLAYSQRSILLSEVAEIAIFEIEHCSSADTDGYAVSYHPKDRFPSIWTIRKILSGLVTVSGIDDREDVVPKGQDGTVSFSHFTVQEYLQGENVSPRKFRLEETTAHWYIMRSCLAYISRYDDLYGGPQGSSQELKIQLGKFDSTQEVAESDLDSEFDFSDSEPSETEPVDFRPFPLLLYAAKYWWKHGVAFCYSGGVTFVQDAAGKVVSAIDGLQGQAFKSTIKVALANKDSEHGQSLSVLANCLASCLSEFRTPEPDKGYALDFDSPLALHDGSDVGDETIVQLLLDAGVNVNNTNSRGETALHRAVKKDHKRIVEQLVEKKASLNPKDGRGRTPLWRAAEGGREAIVKLLLEKGADVESRDVVGRSPLWRAAEEGHEAMVRLLLEKGADVESKDVVSRTPLWWAAEEGHEAMVKLLLEKGADVESKDMFCWTPLWWAAGKGHEAMVKLLLEKGADVESKDGDGLTPLWWAAGKGHEAVVKLLLEKGADVESKDGDGRTPLWWAAGKGHEVMVKLLLEKGANMESRDGVGRTPLWWAAEEGHEAVVRLLLEKGVDVESRDGVGRTPLWWAAEEGHEAVVRLLLEKGADVESKDGDGRTPLWWAAGEGHEAVVKLLLEKGADVESKDGDGQTPLWWAAGKGHEAVVKLLLEKGADVESKDWDGRTPLSRAAEEGREAVVKLLLEKGADVESKTGMAGRRCGGQPSRGARRW